MPKGDHFVDFAWLKTLQARTGLQLATCDQPMGLVHVDGQPAAFAAELIRLAEIGQKLEIATAVAVALGPVVRVGEAMIQAAIERLDERGLPDQLRGMAREFMETMDEAQADVLISAAVALETRTTPPVAAQDEDELRIAVEALAPFAEIGAQYRAGGLQADIEARAPSLMRQLDHMAFRRADQAFAALKSASVKGDR